MSGARLAALHLATLAETDRRWILAQLTVPQRSAITRHLPDAVRLTPSGLAEVLESVSDVSMPSSAAVRAVASRAGLDGIELTRLQPMLDRLPSSVMAAIALRNESGWGSRYLEQKEPAQRRRLAQLAAVTGARVTPAFLERIEASIAMACAPAGESRSGRFEQVLRDAPAVKPGT